MGRRLRTVTVVGWLALGAVAALGGLAAPAGASGPVRPAPLPAPGDVLADVRDAAGDAASLARRLLERSDDTAGFLAVVVDEAPAVEGRLQRAADEARRLTVAGDEGDRGGFAAIAGSLGDAQRALTSLRAQAPGAVPRQLVAQPTAMLRAADAATSAGDALTDRWADEAAAPALWAAVGLAVAAVVIWVAALAQGRTRVVAAARRRALGRAGTAVALVAAGAGASAATQRWVIDSTEPSPVAYLPLGVLVVLAVVVLADTRGTVRRAKRTAAAMAAAHPEMRPGAVPTIQVDERAGMMVWGANLDVLEQLRTAADAVAGPAPAAERSSSEQA